MLDPRFSEFDPNVWSGRAVQEVSSIWQYGLASMYPVSPWSSFAPDHHGYQRACDIFSGQASSGAVRDHKQQDFNLPDKNSRSS